MSSNWSFIFINIDRLFQIPKCLQVFFSYWILFLWISNCGVQFPCIFEYFSLCAHNLTWKIISRSNLRAGWVTIFQTGLDLIPSSTSVHCCPLNSTSPKRNKPDLHNLTSRNPFSGPNIKINLYTDIQNNVISYLKNC